MDTQWQILLADAIVCVHLAFVLFVVLGLVLILIGWPLRWQWVRNWWFRLAHLSAILVVALEATFGIACPLTTWEDKLRIASGQLRVAWDDKIQKGEEPIGFVAGIVRDVLFYEIPQEAFRPIYIGFAGLVLLTWVAVRPRRRKRTEHE